MEIAKKIASNTFSQVFARFFNAFVSILIVRIITDYLAAEGYGRYTIVYSFVAFFDIAADLGLFTIAVSEMSKAHDRMERILGNIMSLRLILVIVLGSLAAGSVWLVPNYSHELKVGIMIAALGMGLNHLGITLSSALQVHYKMPLNAIAIGVSKILMLGMIYYVSVQDLGFSMLIWAGVLNNTLVLLLTFLFARQYMRIRLYVDLAEWKRLLKTTITYGISLICSAFFIYFSPLVLSYVRTEAEVGVFGVANKIVQLLIIVPFAFMNAALPSIARNMQNRARLQDIVQNSFDFLVTLSLGMLAGTVVLSDNIIRLAASGNEFASAGAVLQILIFGVAALFIHNLFSYLLLAADRQRLLLVTNMSAAGVAVIANLILVPHASQFGGTTGAAIASVIPQFLVLIITYVLCRRVLQLRIALARSARIAGAALAMGITIWLLDQYILAMLPSLVRLAILVPTGGVLYVLFAIVVGGVSPHALDIVLKRQPRAPGTKRIAIDIRAVAADKTGKEWYTLNIIDALTRIDTQNQYILYTKYRCTLPSLPPNVHIRRFRLPLVLWHPAMMLDMYFQDTDVLFSPASYIAPSLCFGRKPRPVVVIHDTVAFLFPQKHQLKARIIEKYTVGLALKHAAAIIAVSQHTKRDLVRQFGLTPERVSVVGEAARNNFRVIDDSSIIQQSLQKYHLPDRYILFVGTLEPRKNLRTLLQAYAQLPERSTHKLVIAGKKGWYYHEIFQTVEELHLSNDVIFTGYVDDADLPAILNHACVFVMPSLYEGFGLPLLEAFACGTPVVSSNSSALHEIADGVCRMVDPLKVDELRTAIHEVLTDPALRRSMIERGLARSRDYSWDQAARELLRIINGL